MGRSVSDSPLFPTAAMARRTKLMLGVVFILISCSVIRLIRIRSADPAEFGLIETGMGREVVLKVFGRPPDIAVTRRIATWCFAGHYVAVIFNEDDTVRDKFCTRRVNAESWIRRFLDGVYEFFRP